VSHRGHFQWPPDVGGVRYHRLSPLPVATRVTASLAAAGSSNAGGTNVAYSVCTQSFCPGPSVGRPRRGPPPPCGIRRRLVRGTLESHVDMLMLRMKRGKHDDYEREEDFVLDDWR
jgi:hypothetical protein